MMPRINKMNSELSSMLQGACNINTNIIITLEELDNFYNVWATRYEVIWLDSFYLIMHTYLKSREVLFIKFVSNGVFILHCEILMKMYSKECIYIHFEVGT